MFGCGSGKVALFDETPPHSLHYWSSMYSHIRCTHIARTLSSLRAKALRTSFAHSSLRSSLLIVHVLLVYSHHYSLCSCSARTLAVVVFIARSLCSLLCSSSRHYVPCLVYSLSLTILAHCSLHSHVLVCLCHVHVHVSSLRSLTGMYLPKTDVWHEWT
jgi:hypothetical protein